MKGNLCAVCLCALSLLRFPTPESGTAGPAEGQVAGGVSCHGEGCSAMPVVGPPPHLLVAAAAARISYCPPAVHKPSSRPEQDPEFLRVTHDFLGS